MIDSGSTYIIKATEGKVAHFDVYKKGNPTPIVTNTKEICVSHDGSLLVGVGNQTIKTSAIAKFPEGYEAPPKGSFLPQSFSNYNEVAKK